MDEAGGLCCVRIGHGNAETGGVILEEEPLYAGATFELPMTDSRTVTACMGRS